MTCPQANASTSASPDAAAQQAGRVSRQPWVIAMFLALVALLVAADLGIKHWSFQTVAGIPVELDPADPFNPAIPPHHPRVVIPHLLSLTLTTNTGAVFGSAQGARPLFIAVSLIATVVILALLLRSSAKAWVYHLGLALVLGGALGNLYDRVTYHAVRDMFHLFPGWQLPFGLSWPGGNTGLYPWIFNFADVALVGGVILLAVLSWRHDMQLRKAARARG